MPQFADLYSISEDDRIHVIGETASLGETVGVVLELDDPEKVERYIRKVTQRYPKVVVLQRLEGVPVAVCITIRFGPRPN
jgi:hypothetical protein